MKKRVLSVLLCLVMALSLLPTTAFAAGATYESALAGKAAGSSSNGFTVAVKSWKGTDGNYYLAIASRDKQNEVDSSFRANATAAVKDGKFLSVDYIEDNGTLTVLNEDGTTYYSGTPASASGKGSNIWVIFSMTAEKFLSYESTANNYNIPVISAGGFGLNSITIDSSIKEQAKADLTYTLSYDLNGGSGSFAKQSQLSTEDRYTFTVSTDKPTREGYTFKGWATTANATTPDVGNTVTATKDNRDVTVYAVWEEVITYTYTLKYDLNGGSGSFADDSYTGSATSYDFTVSSSVPTREGYTFKGWATTANATTPDVGNTVTATKDNRDVTVYAVWEVNSYTVTYFVDDEQVGEVETYNYGADVTVRDAYTKEGYTVSAWDKSDFTMPADDVEIHATSSVNSYTVTYFVDDEQVGEVETYNFGADVTVRDAYTKEGYTVSDWDKSDFTMPADDVEIHATSSVKSYTVTYFVDDEQVGEEETYNYGETVIVRDAYTKEGYTVSDWDVTEDFPMPAEDVEIHATSSVNRYTVTYFVDDEQVGEVETYAFGEAVTVRPVYVKEGYTVSAWNRADFTMPAADVEIYATSASNEDPAPIDPDPVDPIPSPAPIDPDPVDPVPSPAPAPVDPDVPATGDTMNMGIWIAVMIIASVGMAAMFVYSKKEEDAE